MKKERVFLNRILASVLCALLFCFNGCATNQKEPINPSDLQAEKHTARSMIIGDIMSEEEYDQLSYKITDSFPEKWNTLFSFFPYDMYSDDFEKLLTVNIRGIPVIISEIELNRIDCRESDDAGFPEYGEYSAPIKFYYAGLEILARTQNFTISEHSNSYEGNVGDDLLRIKSAISEIMSTEESAHKKIEKLKNFGIFALPDVISEIENGNTEYESFFVAAGFHLSDKEFAKLTNVFSSEYDPDIFKTEEYMSGAEDFDYKAWLEENKQDLDNLFKFLDAYCAEYEAEQNK